MNSAPWLEFFKPEELKCHCGKCNSTGMEMDQVFMNTIASIRKEMGVPFDVSSAYRCPEHNNEVSTTGKDGPHTTGKAIDILISGKDAYKLVDLAFTYQIEGIGLNQKADFRKRFVHLDGISNDKRINRPYIWTY